MSRAVSTAGADAYLAKPFQATELIELVGRLASRG